MIFNYDEKTACFSYAEPVPEGCNKYFADSFIRYLNAFNKIFKSAFEKCEFSSLLTLFAVRGVEDAGWDPYESSKEIINSINENSNKIGNYIAEKNLQLWLYGHILEASEPYEKIANLLDILTGETYIAWKFPPNKRGVPQTPGQKIQQISDKSRKLGFLEIGDIYKEFWDKDLRNSIFHSDYILYGEELRTLRPLRIYTADDINKLINYTLAYFQVINYLYRWYIASYTESKVIKPHPSFITSRNEMARIIVRIGHGAIGIKDNWTLEELRRGHIPYRIGRFYPEETKLLDQNPLLSELPEIIRN
jgi:hypothetical protein